MGNFAKLPDFTFLSPPPQTHSFHLNDNRSSGWSGKGVRWSMAGLRGRDSDGGNRGEGGGTPATVQ